MKPLRQRLEKNTRRRDIVRLAVLAGGLGLAAARAASLNQVALQDLNGQGGSDVDKQTTDSVDVKAYENSHTYNRKALFLFDLSSFGGRDVRDQYIHSALFTVWAADAQCAGFNFRLYGFTETTANDDSRWKETIASQTDGNWPDRYFGAYQYPGGNGVLQLDTKAGPAKDASLVFGGSLASYVRWGAGRNPGYGFSADNPDAQITLLVAREEYDNDISGFHAREAATDAYRPRLALDVRFPEIRVGLGESPDLLSGGTYDFGVMAESNAAPVARDLVVDNQTGEALSSLHVSAVAITGAQAQAFAVVDTNFYLAQAGGTVSWPVVFNPDGSLAWGIWDQAWLVLRNNDENEGTFRVNLRGEIFPQLRLLAPEPGGDPSMRVLRWTSRTGSWYAVRSRSNLQQGAWTSTAVLRATGRYQSWTNPDPAPERRFFRVEQLP